VPCTARPRRYALLRPATVSVGGDIFAAVLTGGIFASGRPYGILARLNHNGRDDEDW
jgi:hypothetical protein